MSYSVKLSREPSGPSKAYTQAYICLYIYIYIYVYIYLSSKLSIYLSIYLSISLSLYLPIYLSMPAPRRLLGGPREGRERLPDVAVGVLPRAGPELDANDSRTNMLTLILSMNNNINQWYC